MIQDLRKRMEAWIKKIQAKFNKDLEELKNTQTVMNNTITKMKNRLERIHSKIIKAEENILQTPTKCLVVKKVICNRPEIFHL